MRNAFAKELLRHAKKNKNIMLLTADLGFSVFETFEAELPKQYLNTGCAEANTISVAAGLALSGKKVFVYSIVPFITMRCFEQIRIDICYHNIDVTVVGVGGGLAYGQLGPTHHSIEDIALFRVLPNMKILCPGDPLEAEAATNELVQRGGPSYLRLNRGGDAIIHTKKPPFQFGKALLVKGGSDITIISTGALLSSAIIVREQLKEKGISAAVLQMHTIKPLDKNAIIDSMEKTQCIITLEEHNIYGGLGSAVAEIIAQYGRARFGKKTLQFQSFGIHDRFTKEVGNQEYLRKVNKLDPESITEAVLKMISPI